jgi:hypothetical protein
MDDETCRGSPEQPFEKSLKNLKFMKNLSVYSHRV